MTHFEIVTTFITFGARAYSLDNSEWSVALTLLNHRNMYSGECKPSQLTIAKECGFKNEETARRVLNRLIEKMHIKTYYWKLEGCNKKHKGYVLDVEAIAEALEKVKASIELEQEIKDVVSGNDSPIEKPTEIVETHQALGNSGNTNTYQRELLPFPKKPTEEGKRLLEEPDWLAHSMFNINFYLPRKPKTISDSTIDENGNDCPF